MKPHLFQGRINVPSLWQELVDAYPHLVKDGQAFFTLAVEPDGLRFTIYVEPDVVTDDDLRRVVEAHNPDALTEAQLLEADVAAARTRLETVDVSKLADSELWSVLADLLTVAGYTQERGG